MPMMVVVIMRRVLSHQMWQIPPLANMVLHHPGTFDSCLEVVVTIYWDFEVIMTIDQPHGHYYLLGCKSSQRWNLKISLDNTASSPPSIAPPLFLTELRGGTKQSSVPRKVKEKFSWSYLVIIVFHVNKYVLFLQMMSCVQVILQTPPHGAWGDALYHWIGRFILNIQGLD